jgi:hypothetical protein
LRQSIKGRAVLLLTTRRLTRLHALDPQLNHVAQSLFEWRPVLFLIRGVRMQPPLLRAAEFTRSAACERIASPGHGMTI